VKKLILLFLISVAIFQSYAQRKDILQKSFVYKRIDTTSLKMEMVYPAEMESGKNYPCIVFFFGGGWVNGSINQFRDQAEHLTKRGMVSFLVDYRVQSRQKTTPFESLKDAKSAIRYIRSRSAEFHIDKNSVVAAGGSAGGHLAAATALIDDYNESTDDLSVSSVPNALVLFNPVIDNGPGGYGFERIGESYKKFSPLHNIKKGAPPTVIFLGTKDNLIPVETVDYYKTVMQKVGGQCDVFLYEGQGHGFFNQNEYKENTLREADKFLSALGFLSP
jgi:acetyl esterase